MDRLRLTPPDSGRETVPLPMAADDCRLDDAGLRTQLDRYRRLGVHAITVELRGHELVVLFQSTLDVGMLEEALAVEQGCCSFFTIAYLAQSRRLSIAVSDARRLPVLDAIRSALVSGQFLFISSGGIGPGTV
jgi:hypothetical protein